MAKRWVVGLLVYVVASGSGWASGPARQGMRGDRRDPAKGELAADLVGGRVVSLDGQPVAHAVVSLTDVTTGMEAATTRSGLDGRYRFTPMPAGKYQLAARAAGLISGLYQGHEQFSTAIVLGAGLPTDALELRLTPEAVIYGRVTDEAGDAVAHAGITLFRRLAPGTTAAEGDDAGARATRFRNATTGDTGEFRLENIPPGSYFLAASGVPWYATHAPQTRNEQGFGYRAAVDPALDVAYPQVFYPGAVKPEEASSIELRGGERMSANLQMHAERAVSVKVQMPAMLGPSSGPMRIPQLTRVVFGVAEPVPAQVETEGATVRLTGLVPGQYRVQQYEQTGMVQRGSVEVTGAGATLDLAELDKTQARATVKVRVAGGAALPAGLLFRLSRAAGGGQTSASVGEDGTAEMPLATAGTYRVDVVQGARVLPLLGLSVDGKAVPDLRLRVPESRETLLVEALVALRATRVEGFARRDGKPVGGSMVVLVPAGAALGKELFRRDQSDLDGSFVLNGVAPGNYLLVAVDDGWSLPWTDTAAMARYLANGVPVTVPVGTGPVMTMKEMLVPQLRR